MPEGHQAIDLDPGFAARHRLLVLYLWGLVPVLASSGFIGDRPAGETVLATTFLIAFAVTASMMRTPEAAAVIASLGITLGSAAAVWHSFDDPLALLPSLIALVMASSYRRLPPLATAATVSAALGLMAATPQIGLVWSLGVLAMTLALILAWRLTPLAAPLQAASGLFHISFEEAPVGMAVLRPSGELVEVNKAMTRIVGYDRDHLMGSNISGLVHVDDHIELGEAWEQMGNGATHRATEWMRWVNSNGRPVWAKVSLSLVPRTEDQPALVILQIEDAAAAHDERLRLEGMLKDKDALVATLGEEIRKPLGLLIDLTDLAVHPHVDTGATLPKIEAHAREIAAIVDDIVLSARADSMPVTVVSQTVDAAVICSEVLAEHHADSVTASYEARAMWADPTLVGHIVGNLVGIAIRYGGSDVRLRTISSGPDTVVEVSDDGPEIPDRERERIFDGDLRTGQRVTNPAAVGLSLTVGRHLARLMEGDVEYRRQGGRNLYELRLPSEQITETQPRRQLEPATKTASLDRDPG
jgi:PAS domain S-box-containing protein